jgi:hypothetical protein
MVIPFNRGGLSSIKAASGRLVTAKPPTETSVTKSIVNAGLVLLSAGRELIRVRDQGRSGRADAGVLNVQGRPTLTRAAHKTGRKLYVEMSSRSSTAMSKDRAASLEGRDCNHFLNGGRHMTFVLVNGGRAEGSCTLCREPIDASHLREVGTRNAYCSHECYLTHYDVVAPVPQEHEKAS